MAEYEHSGLTYAVTQDVYDPSDDTWLLIETLNLKPGQRFLEIGCGAGLVCTAAGRMGADVVATDINPSALALTRGNARRNHVEVELVRTDLLRGLRPTAFEVIAFNPPYLPTAPEERLPGPINRAYDGGGSGLDTTLAFLSQLVLRPDAHALLVASTLQDLDRLDREIQRHGFDASTLGRKALNREALHVYRLSAQERAEPNHEPHR